jgi:hypothetical protein
MKSTSEKTPITGLDLSSPEFGISSQSLRLSQAKAVAGLTTTQNAITATAVGERMPPPPPRPPKRTPCSDEDKAAAGAAEAAAPASTSAAPAHHMQALPPQTQPPPSLAVPASLHCLRSLIETIPDHILPKLDSVLTVVHHVLIIQQMREMVQVSTHMRHMEDAPLPHYSNPHAKSFAFNIQYKIGVVIQDDGGDLKISFYPSNQFLSIKSVFIHQISFYPSNHLFDKLYIICLYAYMPICLYAYMPHMLIKFIHQITLTVCLISCAGYSTPGHPQHGCHDHRCDQEDHETYGDQEDLKMNL